MVDHIDAPQSYLRIAVGGRAVSALQDMEQDRGRAAAETIVRTVDRVWAGLISSRPEWLHLSLFYALYVIAGGLGQGLAIIPGVSITFWPPAGLFMATLIMHSRSSWPWWILAGCLAELTCNGIWFANAIPFALLYFAANTLEAVAGAWLLQRYGPRPFRLDTLREVVAFLLLAVAIAPIVGATVIAAVDAVIGKHAFHTAWTLVWLGDSTGLLVSAPLSIAAILAFRERNSISAPEYVEAAVAGAILVAVASLSFAGLVPTLYLSLPALLWIAARFHLRGAAAGIAALMLIVAAFTAAKAGLPAGIPNDPGQRSVYLQMFLGLSAVSALVVAAIASEHRRAHQLLQSANASLETRISERTAALAENERRLSAILEALPIGVGMVDREGRPILTNKVFSDFVPTVVPSRDEARHALWEGHGADGHRIERRNYPAARALRGERVWPGDEFLFHGRDGPAVWTRVAAIPLRDEGGEVVGATVVLSDIDREKRSIDALRRNEQRHRTLVSATSTVTWSCPPSGLQIEPQPEWMAFTGQTAKDVIGDGWTKALHPDDLASAAAKWQAAVGSGEPFSNEQRIRRHDGQWRWMSVHAVPIRDGDGSIVEWFGMNVDITERKQAAERVRSAHDAFRHLVERSPFGIFAVDADFRLVQVSDGARKVFENVRPLIGRDFAEVLRVIWPEPFASEAIGRFRHTLATGEAYRTTSTVQSRADIDGLEAYDWRIERMTLPDGRPGVVCHFYDLSERQRFEEQIKFLMREVNHRSKNLLGLVQSVARQTASSSPGDFLERFQERMQALAASHDLLVKSAWRAVPLDQLVRSQMAHFAGLIGTRISVRGPAVNVTAAAAQTLAMAMHELATNAGKYGALSTTSGTIEIAWTITADDNPTFTLTWKERGGPVVTAPARRGFGWMVVHTMTKMSLGAEVQLDYAPEGVRWQLKCPLARLTDGASAPATDQATNALPTANADCARMLSTDATSAKEKL